MAKAIMLQGTGSGVGKSVLAAALCRIFLQDGYKVAPFKAQNMALNSFVTEEGEEIGRAQAVQAQACRIKPSADINPVLLKPVSDVGAQVIVKGRPVGNFSAKVYTKYKKRITSIVDESFKKLAAAHDIVVIEGAGSPAEINLKSHDIVNMRAAVVADAPVILVGDIDKGGVFAWLIGTLKLLDRKEHKRIKGFIINKFRGDIDLLKSGIKFLENQTGIKVLGVIPYFFNIKIPEEDGIYGDCFGLDTSCQGLAMTGGGTASGPRLSRRRRGNDIKIGVINLPHIANHTDFDALEREDADLSYIDDPSKIEGLHILIIPGTKNTISDMKFLRWAGFEDAIKRHVDNKRVLVGICGGLQMLGKKILDPLGVESDKKSVDGLGLFGFNTIFDPKKITAQVEANLKPTSEVGKVGKIRGYEIHHGRTQWRTLSRPMFIIKKTGDRTVEIADGAATSDFRIWGTHIHGIFDNHNFRKWFLYTARERLGLPRRGMNKDVSLDTEIDKLANLVRKNLDMKALYKILNNKCMA